MSIHGIKTNSPYVFTISNFAFGDLDRETLISLFTDGRVASKFLERHIPLWFSELKFVDETGYDFVHQDGSKYEAKCFTKQGLNYTASKYLGVGRKLNMTEHREHAKNTKYILCDIVSFPQVRIVFHDGNYMVARYPSGAIRYAERNELFCERSNLFD